MKLNPIDVNPIRNMSVSQFADWFQVGFEDIASGDPDRLMKAFAPLHLIITMPQSIVDDLESVYDVLNNARVQRIFCSGFTEAFGRLAIQARQTEALRSILALAQRINAHELITHIVPMLLNTGSCVQDPSLFKHAFDYLAMMASLPAKEAILALVTSERFDPNFSIYAFITLCRCDPASWLEHLEILRPHIAKIRTNRTSKNILLTAKRFVSLVSLNYIAEQILHLEVSRNRTRSIKGDNWLAEALFLGPQSPLQVDLQNDRLMLSRRGKDQEPYPIPDVTDANPEVIRLLQRAENQRVFESQNSSLKQGGRSNHPATPEISAVQRWLEIIRNPSSIFGNLDFSYQP